MHRYPASRLRTAVVLAAIALGGAFVPQTAATFVSAAHAAEPAAKAAPRAKKARAARDTPFGREGDAKKATRTIPVEMSDTMRYFPEHLTVKKGQTVRFNLRNSGSLPHEMVLGTMDDLKQHAALMRKQGGPSHHDEPNMAHVEAGQTGRIVWQFTRAGEFYYGCLVPGHFEAGMIGTIVVR